MDDGVIAADAGVGCRRRYQFRHTRDAERVGEAEQLLDAVQARLALDAAVKQQLLETAAPGVGESEACASGSPGKPSRPNAAPGRDREVVAAEQTRRQRAPLPRGRRVTQSDDP